MNERTSWLWRRSATPPDAQVLSEDPTYRPLFEACDRLEKAVMEAFPHGRAFPAYSTDPAVVSAVVRCLKTIDAVLLLADAGYGPQAAALCRTMMEDVVVGWWCTQQEGRDLARRLEDHELSFVSNINSAGSPNASYLKVLSELHGTELPDGRDIDDRLAKKHWTGLNTKQLASESRSSMRQRDVDTMDELLGLPYLVANLATHSSTTSLSTTMLANARFSRRPAPLLVWDALAITHRVLSLLMPLMRPNASALSDFDSMVDEDRPLFLVLRDGQRTSRNDPCPCGSGRKYKRCHGASR